MLKFELAMICIALVRVYGVEGKRVYLKLVNALNSKIQKSGIKVTTPF